MTGGVVPPSSSSRLALPPLLFPEWNLAVSSTSQGPCLCRGLGVSSRFTQDYLILSITPDWVLESGLQGIQPCQGADEMTSWEQSDSGP